MTSPFFSSIQLEWKDLANFRRCKDFQELKALAKPPGGVDLVCEAAMHLQARCRGWKGDWPGLVN